jgi:hypothetical protein
MHVNHASHALLKIQYVHCCLSTGLVTNGIRLTKRCNALSSRSDITRGLPDFGKSFTLLVCVCFLSWLLLLVTDVGWGFGDATIQPIPKEHPASCTLRWRISNDLGCISHDCKLDLVTIQGNLTGDQHIRDILQPTVRDSWLDVPWGIGCIFASPNPHPTVGYMKQKPARVWPMDLAPCP